MRRKQSSEYTEKEETLREYLRGKVHVVGLPDVLQAIKDVHGSILLTDFDGMIPVDEDGNFNKDSKTYHDCQYRIKTESTKHNARVTTTIYRQDTADIKFETALLVDYHSGLKKQKGNKYANILGDTLDYDSSMETAMKVHKHIVKNNHMGTLIGSYM